MSMFVLYMLWCAMVGVWAGMAELVDAADSKSVAFGRGGSIPSAGTGGSSNGRTAGFGPANRGSSPCPPIGLSYFVRLENREEAKAEL